VLADIGAKKEAKSSKQNFLGEAATRKFFIVRRRRRFAKP
jgi:hypothetical protein